MNFSINLVAEEPPIEIKARSVHCDGGECIDPGVGLPWKAYRAAARQHF